tara:strand:+ start:2608 stop:2781 length:174 start_codon:yes stop_codon:yes gene_type:complete
MNNITTKQLLEQLNDLKHLVKKAWYAGYEQSMEDNFHGQEQSYENSMFYRENKKDLE